MKFTSFTIIILIINLAILLAIGGVLIYLVYLLIKALRKYIKSEPVRKEKAQSAKSLGEVLKRHRTECRMTQEFVAESIGVSRQAVSKWESGICLPDVSVYMELCGILGISMNEFLAGEDISEENIVKISEDNLIQVAKDSKTKQKNLKVIIAVMVLITVLTVSVLGSMIFRRLSQPRNYMMPVDRNSTEMKTAEILSGVDGAYLFRYSTKDTCRKLTIYASEYQFGKLISKEAIFGITYDEMETSPEGIIALIPDFDNFEIRMVLTDSDSKCTAYVPILEDVLEREYYGRSVTQIKEMTPVQYDTEQGVAAFIYGKDGIRGFAIDDVTNESYVSDNDYVYYFSVEFSKF